MRRVYVEDGCEIARELYLGMVIDRGSSRVTFMASTEGGVEIEEVAAQTPEKIIKVAIDPAIGFQPFHGRQIAFGLGLAGKQVEQGRDASCAASTAPSASATRASSRSTRWSSPRTASSSRSTPR